MGRWAPAREAVLEQLAGEILAHYGRGRAIVAVDGVDGAGTTAFADDLVAELRRRGHAAFAARIDDFHAPRAERYRLGESSGEGRYRDSYDYAAFRRMLVEPFRTGEGAGFVLAAFDWRRDAPVETRWTTAPDDAVLVVNGVFLHRPELRPLWNYSVWLDVPVEDAWARLVAADPAAHGAAALARSRGGQELYAAEVDARSLASAIVDNRDPEHPRRVFADSC